MKILVIGSGAREHAIVWKLAQSPKVEKIYCIPGNPGIEEHAECIALPSTNFDVLLEFVREKRIDLTIPGPEAPLVAGIVDAFEAQGLAIFGPSKAAAELEGSKIFAKYIMKKYGIPTADYHVFTDYDDGIAFLEQAKYPCVIKADGLAAGKGALIVQNREDAYAILKRIMIRREFGDAGDKVVVEEFMVGQEASIFAISDGQHFVTLSPAQDHKAIFDGDKGPNTGGMGAYAPAPLVDDAALDEIKERIIAPTIKGMMMEGKPYRGVLYAGLMMTNDGPKVVEFNCRFGDPETQVVLPLLENDLAELFERTAKRDIGGYKVNLTNRAACAVVMASGGYPASYEAGKKLIGAASFAQKDNMVFHAGTKREPNGDIVSAGGRVVSATAIGENLRKAREEAYKMVASITFDGAYYRKDIGIKALKGL